MNVITNYRVSDCDDSTLLTRQSIFDSSTTTSGVEGRRRWGHRLDRNFSPEVRNNFIKNPNESCFVSVTQAGDAREKKLFTTIVTSCDNEGFYNCGEALTFQRFEIIFVLDSDHACAHTCSAVVISILIRLRWLDTLFYWITKEFRGRSITDVSCWQWTGRIHFAAIRCLLRQVLWHLKAWQPLEFHPSRLTSQPSLSRCLESRLTLEGFLHYYHLKMHDEASWKHFATFSVSKQVFYLFCGAS